MNKAVIVINGAGGVGKDTICDLAAKHLKTSAFLILRPRSLRSCKFPFRANGKENLSLNKPPERKKTAVKQRFF